MPGKVRLGLVGGGTGDVRGAGPLPVDPGESVAALDLLAAARRSTA